MKSLAVVSICLLLVVDLSAYTPGQGKSIEISLGGNRFATFLHPHHPGNRIGYRFFEHTPICYGKVPSTTEDAQIDTMEISSLVSLFRGAGNEFIHTRRIEKDEKWSKLDWTYYLVPADDGIELLLVVQTYDEGLPEYYGIQQCFRMSGETNENWRKRVACTPAFSEYDLWAKGDTTASLTYVLRNHEWSAIPATQEALGARTPQGVKVDDMRTQGKLMSQVGPYEATMLDPIDCGLIARIDRIETWVCGIYWENTSHVTNHHPADCLHAIVNIGNIPPYSKRAIRGKIYWFEGTKSDLYLHFQDDFGEKSQDEN